MLNLDLFRSLDGPSGLSGMYHTSMQPGATVENIRYGNIYEWIDCFQSSPWSSPVNGTKVCGWAGGGWEPTTFNSNHLETTRPLPTVDTSTPSVGIEYLPLSSSTSAPVVKGTAVFALSSRTSPRRLYISFSRRRRYCRSCAFPRFRRSLYSCRQRMQWCQR